MSNQRRRDRSPPHHRAGGKKHGAPRSKASNPAGRQRPRVGPAKDASGDHHRHEPGAASPSAGNLAVQRRLSGDHQVDKSKSGGAYSRLESQADRVADQVLQRKECSCGGTCPSCREEEQLLQMKKDGAVGTAKRARPAAENLGGGRGMDEGMRHTLEVGFGTDLGKVRVHTGPEAERSAAAVGARAYTLGTDVVFGRGQYRPETSGGRWLIAHEVAHVIQQAKRQTDRIQRFDDLTQMTITADYAERLPDDELNAQILTLSEHLKSLAKDDPVYMSVQENLLILRQEWEARWLHAQVAGAGPFGAAGGGVTAYQLNPITGLNPDLVASLPEGEIVEVPIDQFAQGGVTGPMVQAPTSPTKIPPMVGPGMTMGGAALSYGTGLHVMSTGFQQAGPNSIGLVAFPQSQTARAGFQIMSGRMPTFGGGGPILPESRILLGHTGVFARVDGQVRMIASYAPESLLETASKMGPVRSGTGGVQAQIINHMLEPLPSGGRMFDIPSARSIEYPVPKAWAQQFIANVPPEAGAGQLYTAMPDTAARLGQVRLCQGQNCVHWGVEMMEDFLTQQSGQAFQVGAEGGPSVIDLRTSGGIAEDAARQRVLIEFMDDVAAGRVNPGQIELPGGAPGIPVVGRMPTSIKLLKIGGKVFMVAGLGISAYRIGSASDEERTKVIFEEAGGMAGGALGSAIVGGACIAFGIATEGFGLLLCGLVGGVGGGLGGTYLGGKAGEAIGPNPVGKAVDAIVESGLKSDDPQVRSDAVLFRGMMNGDTWSTIGFLERFAGMR